jgi:phenylalanyl-tRNA synthetase alpha chain
MLYKIANQPGGFKPAKMFSIDRVFRYVKFFSTRALERSESCECEMYGSWGFARVLEARVKNMLMDRNEAMDATHLAEFFQVEGVVADYDITLGNLVGMSSSFIPHSPSSASLFVSRRQTADH